MLAAARRERRDPGAASRAAGRDRVARRGRRGAAAAPLGGRSGGDCARSRSTTHGLLATVCTEGRLPWAPESAVATRAAALRGLRGRAGGDFAPFSARDACSKTRSRRSAPPGRRRRGPSPSPSRGPDVPVLILSGRDDLRTPLEDARRTARAVPERAAARRARRRPLGAAHRPHRLRPRRARRVPARSAPSRTCSRAAPTLDRGAVRAGDDRRAAPDAPLRPARPHAERDHGHADRDRVRRRRARAAETFRLPGLRARLRAGDARPR